MATDRVLELEKKQTNLKTYIISILIFIAGIGLLYWSKLDAMKKYPAAQAVIRDLGGLFVVSIAITLIWELCAKRAFSDELLTKANISQQISRSGLIHLVHNPHEINWKDYIESSKNIELFFTYGKNWRSTHENELHEFAMRQGTELRVVLPNPENDYLLDELTMKYDKTIDELRNRILSARKDYSKIRVKYNANISIWYTNLTPIFTLYKFDKVAVISLQSYENRKGGVPHLVAKKGGSLYAFINRQFQSFSESGSQVTKRIE